jgi:hypothetical protein
MFSRNNYFKSKPNFHPLQTPFQPFGGATVTGALTVTFYISLQPFLSRHSPKIGGGSLQHLAFKECLCG